MSKSRVIRNLIECPGLQGPGTFTDIVPMTLGGFVEQYKLLVPLMQRRYCWDDRVLLQWWQDMTTRTSHRIGQLIVRRQQDISSSPPTMLIVDGQQRLTATTIMASSIRHELMTRQAAAARTDDNDTRTDDNDTSFLKVPQTIAWLTSLLYSTPPPEDSTLLRALDGGWVDGKALDCARLTHSFLDRRAYAHVLVHGGTTLLTAADIASSPIAQTKNFFDVRVAKLSTADLCTVAKRLFHSVSIVVVDIQTPHVNLSQIYHWLQERVVTATCTPCNPSPGVYFSMIDLVRNVLMASFLGEPLATQEALYTRDWLPFERHVASIRDVLVVFIRETKSPTYNPPPTCKSNELYYDFVDIYDELMETTTSPLDILHALSDIAISGRTSGVVMPAACG
ncbi:Aste57867_15070 [Aphanomyces stellatus]|uniref:Aste57867_15070 protein n=1 Tax=Aphanomyces stellatus TaxID=120398 RepID=A0A485L2J4_9STRA|nr:hypothetical protein As57867_015014 [Aphanomyces stellatus]VFT91883.1 Aste57867_15070 [Aphanomyces stellatus]